MQVVHDWDHVFANALRVAAVAVAPEPGDKSFLEKRLAAALGKALEDQVAPLRVVLDKKLPEVQLPNWDPQPGWLDLALVDEHDRLLVAAELKLDDVDQTLWDIFKVAAALDLESIQAAFVIAAAPASTWQSARDVVELFCAEKEQEWASRFLVEEYQEAWRKLLRGGRGRPTRVPATLIIEPVVRVPVEHFPYELRALRIRATKDALALVDGWPLKARGEILDEELAESDLPADDADEQAFHAFALTTNGYERMGSFRRCADLANGAREVWRSSGELPGSLRELRCCLFFEQRRWHHYGYGFDEEALRYVRELVAAMRSLARR